MASAGMSQPLNSWLFLRNGALLLLLDATCFRMFLGELGHIQQSSTNLVTYGIGSRPGVGSPTMTGVVISDHRGQPSSFAW